MTSERATWDETWLMIAHDMAKRSRCVRSQVGAVIVDSENRVVATSYNGPPENYPYDDTNCITFCDRAHLGPTESTLTSYEDCPALHAEANGLMVCDRVNRLGGTIYVTSHVCYTCAKLIANSGLSRVVVDVVEDASYRSPSRSYDFLHMCDIQVDEVST